MHGDLPVAAVRLADAARYGLTRANLRSAAFRRVSYGAFTPTGRAEDLAARLRALRIVLPASTAYGHLTSAELRGWWLPHRLPDHVLLATTSAKLHVQRQGVYVRRSLLRDIETLGDLPVVTAEQTLVELARDLSLVDLVPLVDCALAGGADPVRIRRLCRRQRGAVNLRTAIELADPRSESWWESVLRLLHVIGGVGPVDSQVKVHTGSVLVARADLHLVGTNRYPECDGGEHRSLERHEGDLRRDKALARLGAERYGYTTSEIAHQPHVIIADAETARGWRHDPTRVAGWWAVAQRSTLTAHGRALLAARLRRYRLAASR